MVALMHDREEIAYRYGFESYAAMLDISEPLPMHPGDTVKCYIAWKPNGNWFLWEDGPVPYAPPPGVPPVNLLN